MSNTKKTIALSGFLLILISMTALTGCMLSAWSAKSAVATFLTYEKYNQWEQAWEMLHPDCQAIWDDKEEFTSKLNQPLTNLKSFEIGNAKIIPSWTFSSTGKTYPDVAEIPITLIYSTTHGDMERSSMIHAVKLEDDWLFFQQKE